jgi:hypothetical protein
MPGQFDFGPQRVRRLSQTVTDWMGGDGVLKMLNASVRHPNIVGDTNTVYGLVSKKWEADGQHLVELEVRNENQAGVATALGGATLVLPSNG